MKQYFAKLMGGCLLPGFLAAASLLGQPADSSGLFPDILYEYIDGAAENFLSYDFKKLAVQNYANDKGQAMSVEIYFHGSAENAFGIYSSEKPLAGNYLEIGSQGYSEAGILNFFSSAYYVKISGFELGDKGQDVLTNLARALAGRIDPSAALPEILRAFPGAGKIANSERFILNNFLGHEFLRAAFVADYRIGGQDFQLFIINANNEAEARAMLEKYAALDKENPAPDIKPGELTINDPYNGPQRIFWQGKFICGSSSPIQAAADHIAATARNLTGR
jgi:hypothetical protein